MIQLRSFGITSACCVPVREFHFKFSVKGTQGRWPSRKLTTGNIICLKRKAFPLAFHALPQGTKVNVIRIAAGLPKERSDRSVLGEQKHHLN